MANQEQLALLKQGVAVWNAWREQNPALDKPDLREINLAGADLTNANLAGVWFSGTNLSSAKLAGAKLAV